jgi:hypothetical protein
MFNKEAVNKENGTSGWAVRQCRFARLIGDLSAISDPLSSILRNYDRLHQVRYSPNAFRNTNCLLWRLRKRLSVAQFAHNPFLVSFACF